MDTVRVRGAKGVVKRSAVDLHRLSEVCYDAQHVERDIRMFRMSWDVEQAD